MRTAVVADDATNGISSIATQGGQKLIEDPYGKVIVVYVDLNGRLSITFANSDPSNSSSWAVPVKGPLPSVPFKRPAAVLVSPGLLQVVVEDGTGLGHINSLLVNIIRDAENDIIELSFGSIIPLDSSGTSQYPAAILAHNGDVISVWWHNDTDASRVKSFRWKAGVGWTGLDGSSSVPDDAIVDSSDRHTIFPNVFQRPDNGHLYVMGNRQEASTQTNIVFNKATFSGSGWSWGVQNLAYEINAARGLFDVPSLAWDPVRQLVVVAYDISFDVRYGVFTLNASDVKVHIDTPVLEIANNEWGNIDADKTTGDYFLFMIDSVNPATNHDNGRVGYVQFTGGLWSKTLSELDSDTNNVGTSVRRIGSSPSLDIVFSKSRGEFYEIRFTRIFRPDAFYSFTPTDDATIRSDRNETTLGTRATLVVDNSPVTNFLLKFNVAGVGAGEVVGARLRLFQTDSSSKGGDFYTASSSWSEDTVTWNNAPPADPGIIFSIRSVAAGVWYEVDLSSIVHGDGPVSLRVTSTSSDGAYYSSREGANPPQLIVAFNRPGGPDTSAPTQPQGLTAVAVSSKRVDLSWEASSDDIGVTGYDVFRNGTKLDTVGGASLTHSDSSVAPSTAYSYAVVAFDASGKRSQGSTGAIATTPQRELKESVVFIATEDSSIRADLPASTSGGAALTIAVDASPVRDILLKFNVSGVRGGQLESAKLRLFQTDSSPRGGDIHMTSSTWSEGTVNWNNAPPPDPTIIASIGRVSSGIWYEANVTSVVVGDGFVSFRISSSNIDGAYYSSSEGSNPPQLNVTYTIVSSETDGERPSQPQNMTATAVSPTQVNLSWQASTDDVGVAGYDVFRNGTKVGTAGGVTTAYQDTTVTSPGTYVYTVVAFDAAGKLSDPSSEARISLVTLTFLPTDDATIDAGLTSRNSNFGSTDQLKVDSSPLKEFLLKFNVTGVGAEQVVSAKLRLFQVDSSPYGGDFHTTSPNWSEQTITWNNAPAADPTVIASLGQVRFNTWYEVDLTIIVNSDGVLSLRVTTPNSDAPVYSSKEGTNPPQLIIVVSTTP